MIRLQHDTHTPAYAIKQEISQNFGPWDIQKLESGETYYIVNADYATNSEYTISTITRFA